MVIFNIPIPFKTLVWAKTIFDTRYILAYACLLTYRHHVPNCQANLFCTYWRNLKCRLQTGYGYIEDHHVCFSYRYAYIIHHKPNRNVCDF
jgi:hypothetical protein